MDLLLEKNVNFDVKLSYLLLHLGHISEFVLFIKSKEDKQ